MENKASVQQNIIPGMISIAFKEGDDLNSLCARLTGYNTERFSAVALRMYTGEETIVTVYAVDKLKKAESSLPVHKFKLEISLKDFLNEIRQMNFTVSDDRYDLWDMEVINK